MKVQCGHCPARYAVADERIAGKKVRLRCKRCGASIVVNGKVQPPTVSCRPEPKPEEDWLTAKAASAMTSQTSLPEELPPSRPPAPTMLGGLEAPFEKPILTSSEETPSPVSDKTSSPSTDSAPPPPSSRRGMTAPPSGKDSQRFRVAVTKDDLRWMTIQEVIEAHSAGAIRANTFVFRAETDSWEMLRDIPELATVSDSSAPPPPTSSKPPLPPSSPPPPRRSRANSSPLERVDASHRESNEAEPPEETVPFSLDPSRASNRAEASKDVSFLALAEQAASQADAEQPEPSLEALEKHLTSPPPANGTAPSMAPPAVPVPGGSVGTLLILLGLLVIAAGGTLWFFGEHWGLKLPF